MARWLFYRVTLSDNDPQVIAGLVYERDSITQQATTIGKLARKERYLVQPRIAGQDAQEPLGKEVKRAASYQIIKNRGLTAHKSKLNRNPRAKKREQFRKATIRRKGQVREMRESAEGDRYAGEATGIRAGLTRSRKIAN